MRSILVGEVRTGRRITQIPVADASWTITHRGIGSIDVSIPLGADEFNTLERSYFGGLYPGAPGAFPGDDTFPESAAPIWRPGDGLRPELLAALEPVRCFLAVLEDDYVIEAGPIWAWDFNTESNELRVKASGLASLFDHRFVMGAISSGFSAWSVTYTGLSYATIAKRLVQLAETHTGGDLPVVLPDDEAIAADEAHDRTYRGSELATVWTRITQLMDVQNGPDIAFEPRLTEDRLGVEWVMRTGTEADPLLHQDGDDWVWDTRAARGGVSGLSVSRDATQQAQVSWLTGSGQDEALVMGRREPGDIGEADLRDVGFPLTEVSESRPTVLHLATANAWAAGNLIATLRPSQTWSCSVLARPTDSQGSPAGPQLGQFRPGDWATVWVDEKHPLLSLLLPTGFQRARLLQVSGGLDEFVNLVLAPTLEVR